jgi:hypothetical protein
MWRGFQPARLNLRRGRTSTELAMLAGVTPSTASVHLKRLAAQQLVKVFAQGKHRYFSLNGDDVAVALEALGVLAGSRERLIAHTPQVLCAARTCYDHIASTLGVLLHDRMRELRWFDHAYLSERRPHLAGAIGAALLQVALKRKWVQQDLDSRVLTITRIGRRKLLARFGLDDLPG